MESVKRKSLLVQCIRHIVQVVCFVLVPGLFISIFSAIGTIVRELVSHSLTWDNVGSSVLLLVIVLPVTAVMGRFFCSYMCAFGTMQEFLWIAAERLHVHKLLRRLRRRDRDHYSNNNEDNWNQYSDWDNGLDHYSKNVESNSGNGAFNQGGDWNRYPNYSGERDWYSDNDDGQSAVMFNTEWGRYLKFVKYVVLGVIAVLFWIIGADVGSSMSPWSVFGLYTSLAGWKTLAPMFSLGGVMLLGIVILSVFVERGFCRYLCPLGAVFSVISGARLVRVKRDNPRCSECGQCSGACMMGVDMSGKSEIRSGECINCFRCVRCCPSGNLSENSKKALVAGLAATMITAAGCIAVNALSARDYVNNDKTSQAESGDSNDNYGNGSDGNADGFDGNGGSGSGANGGSGNDANRNGDSSNGGSYSDITNGTYEDGVYTGIGQGFRGQIKVQVTVSGGKITSIDLVSSSDDQQFFNRAWSSIVSAITGSQSTDVDTVSGATFSSNGIIEAVKDALGEQFTNPNSSMGNGHGGFDRNNGSAQNGEGFGQGNGYDQGGNYNPYNGYDQGGNGSDQNGGGYYPGNGFDQGDGFHHGGEMGRGRHHGYNEQEV